MWLLRFLYSVKRRRGKADSECRRVYQKGWKVPFGKWIKSRFLWGKSSCTLFPPVPGMITIWQFQKMAVKIKRRRGFFSKKRRYFSYLKKWTRVKVNERLIYWYWYAEAGSYGVLRLLQKHDSEHWCHCKRGCPFWQLLMQRCALPAVESGTFLESKNGVVGHGGTAANRFRGGNYKRF